MPKGKKEIKGPVLKINDDFEIHVDKYQYILMGEKEKSFFDTLDMVLEHILATELKKHLLENERQDMRGVLEAIESFWERAEKILEPLNTKGSIRAFVKERLDR